MADPEVPGIAPDAVTAWFLDNIDGVEAPLTFEVIVGGHSNLTYAVTDARGERYVLRRPPLGAVLATAHDMGREHRIISGVGKSNVPVPPALGFCDDESINDAPFYVMGYVDGHVLASIGDVEEVGLDDDAKRALAFDVVDVLADLHRVVPADVGLDTLAKSEAYLDRQLKRWRTQWENSKTRELDEMEDTYQLLLEAKPEQRYTGIVHGDYRLGNMLSRADGTIAAILDWELCTLGDTLADIGYLLNDWGAPDEIVAEDRLDGKPSAAGGFPTRDELVDRYRDQTGREVSNVAYYQAFQHWRLAAIVEGVKARYLKGVMIDDTVDTDQYELRVNDMATEALRLLRTL